MKRVLHIGMSDNLGGIEIFLINFYRKINKKKIQFDFINMYDGKLCFEDEIIKMGGKIYKIPNEKKNPLGFKKELKRIVQTNRYEVVHVHKNSLAFISVFKLLKKMKVKKVIAHSHNTQSSKPNFIINVLHKINKLFLSKYANCFCACSKEAGEWMFSKKILESNDFIILNNAIEIERFIFNQNVRNEVRKEFFVDNETFLVGHVGRFSPQKNHLFLIDFFSEFIKTKENCKLMLVGQGTTMELVKEKVKKLKLEDKVIFVGERIDVNRFYQAFDLFVFPSIYEGLGIVLIEAEASGLPCLASTEVPKLTKIIDDIDYIKLEESIDKWVEVANNILEKFERKNTYNLISNKGFNIEIEVKKLERIYE